MYISTCFHLVIDVEDIKKELIVTEKFGGVMVTMFISSAVDRGF